MSTEPARPSTFAPPPLIPFALAAVAGVVADRFVEPWGTRTWAAIALGAVAALGAVGLRRPSAWRPGLLVVLGALGGGWHHSWWSDRRPDDLARGVGATPRPAWVRGVLAEVLGFRPGDGPGDSGTTRAVLILTAIGDGAGWRAASGRVQLLVAGDRTDLRAGEAVEAAGMLAGLAGPLNPGEFDYREHMRAQGVRLRLAVDDPGGVWPDPGGADSPWHRWLGAVRAWSQSKLGAGLDPRVAPLAAALLLGRREGVDPDVNDAFARTGTTHLLAISGLHLQVLAVALWAALRALGSGRRAAFVAVGAATAAYALLVGLMPSVVRSAAMTVGVCLAGLRYRPPGAGNLLALATLATIAHNPSDVFDVGCQLSFLAIAAIVWGVGPVEDLCRWGYYAATFRFQGPGSPLDALERRYEPWWRSRLRRWRIVVSSGLLVSLVVWLAALPLVALRFHVVAPIGILLNVPLIPLTSLALMAAGLTLGLSALWGPLGAPSAWICARCLELTEGLVRWGAARTWGHWFVPGPSWVWTAGFYALLGLATAARSGPRRLRRLAWGAFGGWSAIGLGLACAPARPEAPEADILAVGHGLAVVIQDRDGGTTLYDCGRMRDPHVGRRVVAPALWSRGVRRIDRVILSHADADHDNGLPDLLDRFAVGEVRVTPGFGRPDDPALMRLLDAVRARGVPIRSIVAGDGWESAGFRFAVRHPPGAWPRAIKDNDRSVVLDVESGGRHLLLTGDLEAAGLVQLMSGPGGPFDVVLAPHHGGRTANPDWFYLWAIPARVVVSQRPPAPGTRDALAPLAARGIPVLRTWERGAIRLRWAGGGIAARGFAEGREQADERGQRTNDGNRTSSLRTSISMTLARWLVGVLGFGAGLGFGFVMVVVEWGAWALVLPGRRPGPAGSGRAPGEPIEARAPDGVLLAGDWHPALEPSGRVVLLLHGFADFAPLHDRIEVLTRRGWSVAALDARAHGRSGGDRASFGGREAGDLGAWLGVVAERSGGPAAVAVWGRSMGSAVAVRAAAEDPRIAALVLEAPLVDLEPTIAAWLGGPPLRLPFSLAFAHLIARRAGSLAGVSLTRPRPIDLAPRVGAPTLIVHGANDPLAPPAEVHRLASSFPDAAPTIEVAGAGHADVIAIGGAALLDRIAAFLDESVRGR